MKRKVLPKSKSALFLMEMIITILFFSIASAICVQLFAQSHLLSSSAEELNAAVAESQNFIEVLRGTDGSIVSVAEQFPSAEFIEPDGLEQYYDSDFHVCSYEDAAYVAEVTLAPANTFQIIHTRFIKLETNEIIYELSATKYINTPQG